MSDHLSRQGVHDGLKDDMDYAIVQLEFLFPDMDLVAPLLRNVKGSVRQADELVGVFPVFGERGDTDAQIERKILLPPQIDNPFSDPLALIGDALSVADKENDDELVSPPSEDEVDVPSGILNPLAGSRQDLVTELVAMGIVDFLEIVQITKEEGEPTLLPSRSGNLFLDALVEVSAVVKVGERISYGEVLQCLLCELSFRNVPEKRYVADSFPRFVSERREVDLEEYRQVPIAESITALFGDRRLSAQRFL